MIAAVTKKKPITGRQLRYAPFPSASLRPWAEQLRKLATKLDDCATVCETQGLRSIEIDGGTMFDKHIKAIRKATGRTIGYISEETDTLPEIGDDSDDSGT